MDVVPVRTRFQVAEAAALMRGLVEANKALYRDDLATIEEYYRGAWFFADDPEMPAAYCPPHGDVMVAYRDGQPAGTVAICRMDGDHCELKSMFVTPAHRRAGVAAALCAAVIGLARSQGYRAVRLTTGIRQSAARRLYQDLGFEIVAPWDSDPPQGYDYFALPLNGG